MTDGKRFGIVLAINSVPPRRLTNCPGFDISPVWCGESAVQSCCTVRPHECAGGAKVPSAKVAATLRAREKLSSQRRGVGGVEPNLVAHLGWRAIPRRAMPRLPNTDVAARLLPRRLPRAHAPPS